MTETVIESPKRVDFLKDPATELWCKALRAPSGRRFVTEA